MPKTQTLNFIHGKWHAWDVVNGYYLSDEDTKTLRFFRTFDAIVTWLYVNDEKTTARVLNAKKTIL